MRRYLLDSEDENDIEFKKGYDVIIAGSGLAGLYAALHISPKLSVAVITKANIKKSNSWYAQGGIASVMNADDNYGLHVEDTLKAGAGLCDKKAVEVLVKEGPENIRELIEMNVPFDTDDDGSIMTTREGGHRRNRIVHCGGDATGRETTKRLGQIVQTKENIDVLTETYIVDVVTDKSGVTGIIVSKDGKLICYPCKNIILATGGIGQIYKFTTNPAGAVGDGMALAARAGATVERMEMVQFHPTTLMPNGKAERLFLISEAVRGEGGILKNTKGEAFMKNAHELRDLAPRDIVTRAILADMAKTGDANVFLDVTSMTREFFAKRFPTIFAKCEECGIDIPKDYIPVRPGQHYVMGGIKTDLDGKTGIPGLYACGEAASTGIHGANRLASNSMLECLVFGRRCARYINKSLRKSDGVCKISFEKRESKEADRKRIARLRAKLRSTMTELVGPVRTPEGLQRAKKSIDRINAEVSEYKLCDRYGFELYNMGQIASSVIKAAIARKESIGAHYMVSDASMVK